MEVYVWKLLLPPSNSLWKHTFRKYFFFYKNRVFALPRSIILDTWFRKSGVENEKKVFKIINGFHLCSWSCF